MILQHNHVVIVTGGTGGSCTSERSSTEKYNTTVYELVPSLKRGFSDKVVYELKTCLHTSAYQTVTRSGNHSWSVVAQHL